MAEKETINSEGLFPPKIVQDIFSKVKGHSTIAKLVDSEPMPMVGTSEWILSMDGEASVVAEGTPKPAGKGKIQPKIIKPFKVLYQMRVTDEFLKMSDEEMLPHMEKFKDGFAKKLARAIDIVGIHGIDPASRTALPWKDTNSIDGECYLLPFSEHMGIDVDAACSNVSQAGYVVNGVAFSPMAAQWMGDEVNETNGFHEFPDFRFGAVPDNFAGGKCDKNTTIGYTELIEGSDGEVEGDADLVIVGDFSTIKWGYGQDVTFEVIEFGDPDGQGDLKRSNEVVLRAEAYIGLGILDPDAISGVKITEEQSE